MHEKDVRQAQRTVTQNLQLIIRLTASSSRVFLQRQTCLKKGMQSSAAYCAVGLPESHSTQKWNLEFFADLPAIQPLISWASSGLLTLAQELFADQDKLDS